MVARAERRYQDNLKATIENEKRFAEADRREELARRLVVTNIAADAELEDLQELFRGYDV